MVGVPYYCYKARAVIAIAEAILYDHIPARIDLSILNGVALLMCCCTGRNCYQRYFLLILTHLNVMGKPFCTNRIMLSFLFLFSFSSHFCIRFLLI